MQKKDIDTMRRARNIDGLIRALADPGENTRLAAAEALGSVGDERAMEPLERIKFSDTDVRVRRAASLAHTQVAARLAAKRSVEDMRRDG
ncbi:MAG: HEAT repeat domain-containing protein [Methanomicrobiales archaeon]|nr:HEAT repeat domain-containing protein [Methanomicrobiales archaeon]